MELYLLENSAQDCAEEQWTTLSSTGEIFKEKGQHWSPKGLLRYLGVLESRCTLPKRPPLVSFIPIAGGGKGLLNQNQHDVLQYRICLHLATSYTGAMKLGPKTWLGTQ
jgi:hypothetical protein